MFKMGSLWKVAIGPYSIYVCKHTSCGWTLHECNHVKVLVLHIVLSRPFCEVTPTWSFPKMVFTPQIIQNDTALLAKTYCVLGIPHFKNPPHRLKIDHQPKVSRMAETWTPPMTTVSAEPPNRVFCASCYAKCWWWMKWQLGSPGGMIISKSSPHTLHVLCAWTHFVVICGNLGLQVEPSISRWARF